MGMGMGMDPSLYGYLDTDSMMELYTGLLPYMSATQKEMMDNERLSLNDQMTYNRNMTQDLQNYDLGMRDNQFGYDKLGVETQLAYDRLGVDTQMKLAEMEQTYNLKMTELMGVDPDGNITLDARKWEQQFMLEQQKFQHSAQVSAANAQTARMRAQNSHQQAMMKAQQALNDSNSKAMKDQLNYSMDLMDSSMSDMSFWSEKLDSLTASKQTNTPAYKEAQKRFQEANQRYNSQYTYVDTATGINVTAGIAQQGIDRNAQATRQAVGASGMPSNYFDPILSSPKSNKPKQTEAQKKDAERKKERPFLVTFP